MVLGMLVVREVRGEGRRLWIVVVVVVAVGLGGIRMVSWYGRIRMEKDEEDEYFCSRGGLEQQRRTVRDLRFVFEDDVVDVKGVCEKDKTQKWRADPILFLTLILTPLSFCFLENIHTKRYSQLRHFLDY